MAVFLLYLIKSTLCLTVFSVFFRLLLTKETFFRVTRFTLLAGLMACSILPLVKIRTSQTYSLQQPVFQLEETLLSEKIIGESSASDNRHADFTQGSVQGTTVSQPINEETKNIPWYSIGVIVYWMGVGFMWLRFVLSLIRIRQLISSSRIIAQEGYTLAITPNDVVAFSFFRYVVLSEKDYRDHPDKVILHEQMHMHRRHNLDVLFSELFLTVHWFNPMVWLLSRDLREIHEYEADNAVICKGIDAAEYQLLLVKKAVGERRFTSVVNSFNQSKIKNRITMMLKKESTRWAQLKVLFVVPLAAVMLAAFAQPVIEQKTAAVLQQNPPESTVKQVQADPFFYWNQVQEYGKKNGIDPKELNLADIPANKSLVLMLINSRNQVMYRNSASDAWFKTPEEAQSEASVQALKKIIVEVMNKSGDSPVYFSLQNDMATSTGFIVHFINTTLPKAYDAALEELSERNKSSVSELKEQYPLLLLYANPMVFDGNANKRVSSKKEKSETFTIRTSTEKNGKEEMSFWRLIRENWGKDIQTVTMSQEIISGNKVIEEKSPSAFTLGPVDVALVSVGTDMKESDLNGLKTHILDERFKPKNSYFILSI